MKNINETIYQRLKKRIGKYITNDHAVAKKIVVEMIEVYLNGYGKK